MRLAATRDIVGLAVRLFMELQLSVLSGGQNLENGATPRKVMIT